MTRALWAFGCSLLAGLSTGCAQCQNPYDYSPAVVGQAACPDCGVRNRAGSVLSGAPNGGALASGQPTPATPDKGDNTTTPESTPSDASENAPATAAKYETADESTAAPAATRRQ